MSPLMGWGHQTLDIKVLYGVAVICIVRTLGSKGVLSDIVPHLSCAWSQRDARCRWL